jgi:hypothetical protein
MTSRSKAWGIAIGALGLTALPGLVLAAEPARPTFTKDVAPIFQQKCEACHRPGSMAPMSLQTFQDARPWARAIKSKVTARLMPPWHIDKTVGIQEFRNDRSLSNEQLETIVRWVDAGAPMGDPKDMPPPVQWDDRSDWKLAARLGREPDIIVKADPYTMEARTQDKWWKPYSDVGLTEPRWVMAAEVRSTPKGRSILHHAVASLIQDESLAPERFRVSAADTGNADDVGPGGGAGLFYEWAVGKDGDIYRDNTGKLLLPGAKIRWDIHYSQAMVRDSEPITDQVELGIYLYPPDVTPKYRTILTNMGASRGRGLDIPPNTIAATQGFTVLSRGPARIENFQPHMHLRGKAMLMEAILPDGSKQTLSFVNNYQFNWHNTYEYADQAAPLLPKGTIISITAWHDNTAANPNNPDPSQWVGNGDRSIEEMAHAWVNVTYLSEADYKAEVEARRSSVRTNTQQQQQDQ